MIEPGATIGILGGGQLGRMTALAAASLGYRTHVFCPEPDSPGKQVTPNATTAAYDDRAALQRFAETVDVVTFEFENVSAAAAAEAEAHAIVRPNGRALHIAQHRIREKSFLADRGLPVTPFAAVRTEGDLVEGVARVGVPAVLKTASFGYDGKGQVRVERAGDAAARWAEIGRQEAVLEAFLDLELELSVIGARGVRAEWSYFGPFENAHRNHILDVSVAPAPVAARVASEAVEITRAVMDALDYVGILCVEFFLARDGRLLINELAPRPHNSGHLTFDACRTSQFEQQLRAICGLPLGSPELLQPAAMANLLGDVWAGGEPKWDAALAFPAVKLHLYGKAEPRPGRKMGHLTALAPSRDEARSLVLRAREALMPLPSRS
jgi:5-(carboxyamino)imidazole ribonucleotide synthase